MIEIAPPWVALMTASRMAFDPAAKFLNSNTPGGLLRIDHHHHHQLAFWHHIIIVLIVMIRQLVSLPSSCWCKFLIIIHSPIPDYGLGLEHSLGEVFNGFWPNIKTLQVKISSRWLHIAHCQIRTKYVEQMASILWSVALNALATQSC